MKPKKTDDQIQDLQMQINEWKSKYLRALADYQNLEKRSQERINEVRHFASEVVLSRLLPIVDTFTKVKEHIKDEGLDLAYKELQSVLAEQGIEYIPVLGKQFNPDEMECIEVVDGKENTIIEEVVPGYRFRGKVLRVAKVKVGKSEPKSN